LSHHRFLTRIEPGAVDVRALRAVDEGGFTQHGLAMLLICPLDARMPRASPSSSTSIGKGLLAAGMLCANNGIDNIINISMDKNFIMTAPVQLTFRVRQRYPR
jgi:hypothetical protein